MKIAHVADLHFRLNSRFEQYKYCFDWFFNYLVDNDVKNICIVGDIVHSYLNTSTQLVENLSWFFKKLNYFNTYILEGNHDLSIHSPAKKSIVEILIKELELKNIVLFTESKSYPINDEINFVSYSLKDKNNWNKIKLDKNKTNIGIYHGAIAGSLTSLGYQLPGEINIEFFENLDYLLCGDIHLRQFLNERKNSDGQSMPWAGYCGSPIAQNFAETGDKGGLIWDIHSKNNWNVEGFDIPNPNPFITIDYKKDAFSLLKECEKYPKTSYFRISHNIKIPESEKEQVRTELSSNGASQIVFDSNVETDISNIETKNIKLKKEDLKEHKTHFKLVKEFLGDKNISNEDWKKFSEISKKYINKINEKETHIFNKKWSIDNIEFSNTYGYGEENNVNLKKLNGIIGVFGKNKLGKSSFAGTITYGLFGSSDRGALRNLDVVNNRKDNCSIEIKFSTESKKFLVKRNIWKKEGKKKTTANASLELYRINNKNEIIKNFNNVDKNEMENKIRSLIGTKQDFFYTSFAPQEELKSFIKEGSTKRKLYINRFLGLDIFEKIYSLAKEDFDEIKHQMKNFGNKNWSLEIEKLKSKKEENEKDLLKLKENINKLSSQLDENKAKLIKLKISDNASSSPNPDIIKKDLDEITDDIDSLNKELKNHKDKKKSIHERIDKTNNFLEKFSIDKIENEIEKQNEVERSIANLESQYKLELSKLETQKKSAKKLNTIPCGDQYPNCKFIKSSFIDKAKLPEQENVVKNFLNEINNIKNNIDEEYKNSLKDKKEKYFKVKNLLSNLRIEIVQVENKIVNINEHIERKTSKKEELESLYKDSKEKYNKQSFNELFELENIVEELKNEINLLENKKDEVYSYNGEIKNSIKTLESEKQKYDSLKRKWNIYNMYLDAVGKKGISLQILNNQIPAINKEISNILSDIVDFNIELGADLKSNSLDIFIIDNKGKRLIETGCGMEKVFASLSLRIALIKLSNYISTWDTILLDESLDGLDSDNINECYKLFEMLKKEFKNIIIITHKESIKAIADCVIEINEKDGFSKIES